MEKQLKDYSYPCSADGHGLAYPGFSVVMMQIFTLDYTRKFTLPEDMVKSGFVTRIEKSIDSQIFKMQDPSSIQRYKLKGFEFELPLEEPYPIVMSGHVYVEMSLLFGHTLSFTYRFLFDGNACRLTDPEDPSRSVAAATDHLIALMSTHLSAEHWSRNSGDEDTNINYEVKGFKVSGLNLDEEGNFIPDPGIEISLDGDGRVFDMISHRYKVFVKDHCTEFNAKYSREEVVRFKERKERRDKSSADLHYAMVDLWENIQHPCEEGDLFAKDHVPHLSEAQIVDHIRDYHKAELIGLMTLYPGEWPYRDDEAYDEVCGENIAIDTDDLVLCNNNIAMVLGTYGRRGSDSPVDWEEHLKERSVYHVSWPEYLLILEMILAKKYVIGFANEQLIDATLDVEGRSSEDIIADNAALSMRLTRLEMQLDAVKYSKFMSHKVMFDRTTRRLEVDADLDRLHSMMESVDSSLHNLSDYKSMRSGAVLNFILAIISVASTFELLFQNSEMPFLSFFGIENSRLAATLVFVVAAITVFAILLIFSNYIKKAIVWFKRFLLK